MDQKSVVLLVNHREKNCGVHQYGHKLFLPLLNSTNFSTYYIDIEHGHEFYHWRNELQPRVIIFNYYNQITMPWLTHDLLNNNRALGIKQATIHHEGTPATGFDLILDQDPTGSLGVDSFPNVRLPRPIPEYHGDHWVYMLPIVSSFGFGLGGKGFKRVVLETMKSFQQARIRLNIPFAKFGDEYGLGALSYFKECTDLIENNPNYTLELTHKLMPQDELLAWLAESTINCFFYDNNYGRGISGTVDYCLAVRKPFAITKSWQFKHIWTQCPEVLIDNKTLYTIVENGVYSTEKLLDQWNTKTLINTFEDICRRLLNAV